MKIAMVACEPAEYLAASFSNLSSACFRGCRGRWAAVIDERQSDAVGGVGVDPAAIETNATTPPPTLSMRSLAQRKARMVSRRAWLAACGDLLGVGGF